MTTATPRPWRTGIGRFGVGSLAAAAPGLLLAEVYPDNRGNRIFAERHEDAALIVQAVNAHDALVAFVQTVEKITSDRYLHGKAEALLRDLDAPAGRETDYGYPYAAEDERAGG